MPELPEVETIRCGLEPLIVGKRIDRVIVRTPKLRWPIPLISPGWCAGRLYARLSAGPNILSFAVMAAA